MTLLFYPHSLPFVSKTFAKNKVTFLTGLAVISTAPLAGVAFVGRRGEPSLCAGLTDGLGAGRSDTECSKVGV